ncbi:MAG: NAD(P)-dependent oxidoreductase [Deltaproteobacteria bacterium]|nr:NAD(P)-dependent oxidoreductase [Deltaproteobacteria bacterium]
MQSGAPTKVAITGGTGFLGSHLVARLTHLGYRVTCITRSTSNTRWIDPAETAIVPLDLLGDRDTLAQALDGQKVVFHVAGAVKALNYAAFLQTNANATEKLIEACLAAAHPPRRVVLVSSVAACGPAPKGERINGTQTPRPITDYGRSKLEGERRALAFKNKIEIVIVRPGAIYGPRDLELLTVFNTAKRSLFPAPKGRGQIVNMAYVTDIAEGIRLAGEAKVASGGVFTLGATREHSVADLAAIFGALLSRRVRVLPIPHVILYLVALGSELWARLRRRPAMLNRQKVPELRASWHLDLDAARARLGYAPHVDFPEGARQTLAWYQHKGFM